MKLDNQVGMSFRGGGKPHYNILEGNGSRAERGTVALNFRARDPERKGSDVSYTGFMIVSTIRRSRILGKSHCPWIYILSGACQFFSKCAF